MQLLHTNLSHVGAKCTTPPTFDLLARCLPERLGQCLAGAVATVLAAPCLRQRSSSSPAER